MRIWTIHPRYLDRQGLLALWREGLLAQAVLLGKTKGYRHHPQLARFRDLRGPVSGIATYLAGVYEESKRRGYNFDKSLIRRARKHNPILETRSQLHFEWGHLKSKLRRRSPDWLAKFEPIKEPEAHPLFLIIPVEIRDWER